MRADYTFDKDLYNYQEITDDEILKKDKLLSIGKAAKVSGVSPKTLRYYESLGLIHPKSICSDTGYRYYDEETLLLIPVIKYYKQVGFNLQEITKLVSLPGYSGHYHSLRNRVSQLNEVKKNLQDSIVAADDWADLIREGDFVLQNGGNQEISVKYYTEDKTYCHLNQPYHYDYRESIINLDWIRYLEENEMEISGPVILKYASHKDKMLGKANRATILQKCLQFEKHAALCFSYGNFMALSTYHLGDLEKIDESYQRMIDYAKEHHYEISNESYERHVIDYWTTQNFDEFVTELIIPINSKEGGFCKLPNYKSK